MNAMLNAQVLYDVRPEKPVPVAKKKPAQKKKPQKPVLQAQAETKPKSSQN
jgi:hypothetical protein